MTSPLTVIFETVNALPASAIAVMTYPEQLTLTDGDSTQCIVKTYATFQNQTYCKVNTTTREVTLYNVFGPDNERFFGNVTIILDNAENPDKNHPLDSYEITTYTDENTLYKVDYLAKDKMYLALECLYPCDTCAVSDKNFCTSCWMNDLTVDPTFYMDYNTSATCKYECDFGYSANLTFRQDHVCSKCHDSCIGCFPSSTHDCRECNRPEFPYQVEGTNHCQRDCIEGQFIKDSKTCGHCEAPC